MSSAKSWHFITHVVDCSVLYSFLVKPQVSKNVEAVSDVIDLKMNDFLFLKKSFHAHLPVLETAISSYWHLFFYTLTQSYLWSREEQTTELSD